MDAVDLNAKQRFTVLPTCGSLNPTILMKSKLNFLFLLTVLPLGVGAPASARAAEARLLRFPAIHGDQIAFGYAGDLYTVSATGGLARRLTSHEGYET